MKALGKVLLVGVVLFVFAALLSGCSQSAPTTTPTTQPPAAVTTSPPSTPESSTTSSPTAPAVTGIDLGKMIFTTGNDNTGAIPHRSGIAKIKVQACKNCHGDNAKGLKNLGPDIRGSKLQPDFDETKFARAVTQGIDDAGKRLESTMPRFQATPEDTDGLWLYLNSLK